MQSATLPTSVRELLTRQETVEILGCSLKHLDNMIRDHLCPKPVRLGKAPRFRRSEIMEWIAAGCPAIQPVG